MISKSHPLANFLKVTGNIYATTLQRVKEDSQARSKEDPTFSGITPETNHWFWNEQLPKLCNDDFYRKQVEAEIEELDMKALNKDLFDKKIEEFILPSTKNYPEISDLEYFYDYSYSWV